MRRPVILISACLLMVPSASMAEAALDQATVRPTTDFTAPEPSEDLPGGAATVPVRDGDDAFSYPSANIEPGRMLAFKNGRALFRKNWVAAPAATLASDGLGPLYNARACQHCHLKDGRGHPPQPGGSAMSMVLRLAVPGGPSPGGIAGYLATLPDPTYGAQLQDFASPGQTAEGRMTVSYASLPVLLSDGSIVTLQSPTYGVAEPQYGPLHPDIMLSPRIAPQMIGLGLLEAIPEADILANADENDADGDGISGRANVVWSKEHQAPMLGRFGHKAASPNIRHQSAAAFADDMGLSTTVFPTPSGDCTTVQTACITAPSGQRPGLHDGLEVDAESLDLIVFYSRNLGVPARRNTDDPQVLAGKKAFYQLGCPACHRPKFATTGLAEQPEQSAQLIWPYSDLLLHDMGEALADNRPEARATGREWRTPPLWGIGLTETVSGHTRFLHDGRARNLLEALLWHGGEAEASRNAVIDLAKPDRDALIAFLESL